MNRKVIVDAVDYEYPSKDERLRILENYPRISVFGFPYQKDTIDKLYDSTDWEGISNKENLFWWDNCLQNKLGKLQNAYVNALTHYERVLSGGGMVKVNLLKIADFQFKFYSETFYYFLFSSRDIILQILNLHATKILREREVGHQKVLANADSAIQEIMGKFQYDMHEASNIRNQLTHNFPVNQSDNRSKVIISKDGKTYHTGGGEKISSGAIVSNMKNSILRLHIYIEELKAAIGLMEN